MGTMFTRKWMGIAGLLVSASLLAACGSSPSAGNGSSTGTTGTTGTTTTTASSGGCTKGSAGSTTALSAPEEPTSGVSSPTAKCWASIAATPLTVNDSGTIPSGDTVSFKMAWTASDLYILTIANVGKVEVGSPSQWWNDSSTEYDITATSGQSSMSFTQDCHLALTPATSGTSVTFHNMSSQCYFKSGPTGSVATTSKGFETLAVIPWSAIALKAAKGASMPFDIGEDIANSSARVAQPFWAGKPGASPDWPQNPGIWGTVTLA